MNTIRPETETPDIPTGQAPPIRFGTAQVGATKVFYREAGAPDAPVLLLLHGFPTSSHMFRDLMPLLAGEFRVIAPDLPSFGFTETNRDEKVPLTFDELTGAIEGFVSELQLDNYALYVFDYGAPVGFRLAMKHPERVRAIISQNGNAYEEGLSEAWSPLRAYWQEPSDENRQSLRAMLQPETTRWQYTHGTQDETQIAPESYTLDQALLERAGNAEMQLDLMLDYRSNVALYPQFQEYFRQHQPPLLAIWGRNDPFFLPAGAQAYRRDLPGAQVQLLETGHFALETHAPFIADAIRTFLKNALA